jgi:hypothetical protein
MARNANSLLSNQVLFSDCHRHLYVGGRENLYVLCLTTLTVNARRWEGKTTAGFQIEVTIVPNGMKYCHGYGRSLRLRAHHMIHNKNVFLFLFAVARTYAIQSSSSRSKYSFFRVRRPVPTPTNIGLVPLYSPEFSVCGNQTFSSDCHYSADKTALSTLQTNI